MRGEVQGLDSAPGAEVEGASDGFAQRELGQRGGGGADAEHVVGRDAEVGAVEAGGEVGDDPEVRVAMPSLEAYGRTSSSARTSPPEVRTKPASLELGRPGPGRARSASSVETAVWSRNSRVKVASGEPAPSP